MSLINTITKIELESQEKAQKDAKDLLDLGDDSITNELLTSENCIENSFYTGNLTVNDKDYEDFKEIQSDIKSNSILITILVIIFIIILITVSVILLNKYLNWGLF